MAKNTHPNKSKKVDVPTQFILMLNAGVPLKCKFCHELIHIENGVITSEEGVYHVDCHYKTHPEGHGFFDGCEEEEENV